jgi:cation-transporting P-type ATPase I
VQSRRRRHHLRVGRALFAVIETPGVSHFFGCTPIGPVAWAVVVSSAATGTLAAVAAPHVFLAREQES